VKGWPVAKSPINLTFSNDNSNSDEDHEQQEGDNIDCYPTFEARCSSCEPHLLSQGDLNDLVRDLNLSEKQVELLVLDKKGGMFSTKVLKYVSFANVKLNSKNISLRKELVFCNNICSVTGAPEHQYDPGEWF
jgi:hypothetical protein